MYLKKLFIYFICAGLLLVLGSRVQAQNRFQPPTSTSNQSQVGFDSQGRPIKKSTGSGDTLKHRDPLEDSLTLSYRYFDSSRSHKLDSSISNFYSRYAVPNSYVDLGNLGSAARNLIFTPYMKTGLDPGFHAYDIYKFSIEDSKFYTTTRPYSELAYLIGSKTEQYIQLQHTQNRNADFNFAFDFRFINSPGELQNQSTNHNALRLTANYISQNRRYGNYFIFINNKIRSSENGGLQDQGSLDAQKKSSSLGDVFQLPVRLGNGTQYQNNFFTSTLPTGTSYDENTILFRQYYDLGQKDSLVKDTITYRLFYPRIRFQHTLLFSKTSFAFKDTRPLDSMYRKFYDYILTNDTVSYKDSWQKVGNELSIISFPEKKNLNQYLKVGAGLEFITGDFKPYIKKYTNIYANAEYRNRTRNQKWDVVINGQLYLAGGFTGDYSAYISLRRELSKKLGSLEIGFTDVNRTPSFVASQTISSFPSLPDDDNFKKENIARVFANVALPVANLMLTGEYYVVTNYVYFKNNFTSAQQSALFNLLHLGLEKKFSLARHINWYTNLDVQQVAGASPVHVPLVLTRNRIAFEGNFYTNLFLSAGLEIRYYTAYKADGYAPLVGQFYSQDTQTISARPDVNVFLNFRIKSFKAFIRFENVNTLNFSTGAFNERNLTAPNYPSRGLWFRIGIWWNFVN